MIIIIIITIIILPAALGPWIYSTTNGNEHERQK
jgi:hypothetical protein